MLQVSEFVILRLVCSTGHDPALFSGRPGQSAQCWGEGGRPRAQGLHHIPAPYTDTIEWNGAQPVT